MLVLTKNTLEMTINYNNFINFEWPDIFFEFKRVMNLSKTETEKIQNHSTAHLIAYIPYIARCKDYQRIAVAELCIYCVATRSALFKHRLDETVMHRVRILIGFPGGNAKIKKAGLLLLALISISDHKRDLCDDIMQKVHNPLIFYTNNQIVEIEQEIMKKFKTLTAGKNWDFDFFVKYIPVAWWY